MTDDLARVEAPPPAAAAACPPAVPYWLAPPEDEEFSVLDLLRALRRRWLWAAAFTILGTAGAVAYALLAKPVFKAEATIAPPPERKSSTASAALAALGGLGADVAGSLGLSLGGTDAGRLEALLKSHRLVERVVKKYDLLPVLLADRWDPAAKRWKVETPEDVPNVWDAQKELDDIYKVKNDATLGVLTLSLELGDKEAAVRTLDQFLTELALLIQEDEFRRIEANRRFAEQQLSRASDPLIVAKLQSLLAEQVEKAMMARNAEQFAFERIDPPAASDKKVSPKRALVVAGGGAGSLVLGVLLAFFADWVAGLRASEKRKRRPVEDNPA